MPKLALSKSELLQKANEEMKHKTGYIDGMKVEEAEMQGSVLLMRGNCFLNRDGSPSKNTPSAISFYQEFAHEFSQKYTLA